MNPAVPSPAPLHFWSTGLSSLNEFKHLKRLQGLHLMSGKRSDLHALRTRGAGARLAQRRAGARGSPTRAV